MDSGVMRVARSGSGTQSKSKSYKYSLPKQYHHPYVNMNTINTLQTNLHMPNPALTLSPLSRGTDKEILTTFLFSFFQFSLEAQSPQLPSKEDTSFVDKGGEQQRWHSNATLKSTLPGTRLIVTSCPSVTSCWWEIRLCHHSHPHAGGLGTMRLSDLREVICAPTAEQKWLVKRVRV